jgi:hypothetical protein
MYIHQESITRLYPTNKQASKRLLNRELVPNKQASKQEIVTRACTQQASKQARDCSQQASKRLYQENVANKFFIQLGGQPYFGV